MERNEDNTIAEDSQPNAHFDDEPYFSSSRLFFDRVGEVILSLFSTGLSWKPADSLHDEESACSGWQFLPERSGEIKFSDIYAVELANWGSIRQMTRYCFIHQDLEVYRFTVHAMQRCKTKPSVWKLVEYTFGHRDQVICQMCL